MSRPRRKPLSPAVETLESRQLLSRGGEKVLPFRATPSHPLHQQAVTPRPDLDAFARQLALHPRLAARAGLGGLATELRRNTGFAAQHGWGACLVMELQMHPAYAAVHHLTALISPARPVVVTTSPALPTTPPVAPTAPSGATPPATPVTQPVATPTPPTGAGGQGPTSQDALSVAVGSTLDTTVPNGGLTGPGLTYTITPQPLPANMTFNRGTGELVFAPAPGQVGTYAFTVTVSSGTRSVAEKVPVTVNNPAVPSTEVSGQVVDESGKPLAGIEVMVGSRMAMTDAQGGFTLTGVPANPGPLTVDGLHTALADRMMVMAPMDQVMGHPLYADANNVAAKPVVLPRIDVAHAVDFSTLDHGKPIDVTNPALPGVHLTLPPNSAKGAGGAPFTGKLILSNIPASEIREELPPGVVTGLVEVDAVGLQVDQPVQVTLPNTAGYAPGTVLDLWTMNWATGAHDLTGQMVVSADGKSMTSVGGVRLTSGSMPMGSGMTAASPGSGIHAMDIDPNNTVDCLAVTPKSTGPAGQNGPCTCGGQPNAGGTAPGGGAPPTGGLRGAKNNGVMDSDAGMATGEYYQDHATVAYQSQGQARGLDFQYSSLQGNAQPVVEFDPSTQVASNSAAIASITAQVTLAGVVQGSPVTYTPSNLRDGETFRVPLQVDATQLATGAYQYTMVVTANYTGGPSLSQTYQGTLNVVNGAVAGGSTDPLGAGWSIGGLQQIFQSSSTGPALITAGSEGTQRFDQLYVNGQTAYQDLAVASGAGTVVYTNSGTGEFTGVASSAPGDTPVGTAAGDFNGDGKPDMAVVSASTLTVFTNNGAGGFNAGTSYTLPSGATAEAVAAGNFSGHTNGALDLAVLLNTSPGNEVAVYTGNGDGTFSGPVVSSLDGGLSGAATMAIGDSTATGRPTWRSPPGTARSTWPWPPAAAR